MTTRARLILVALLAAITGAAAASAIGKGTPIVGQDRAAIEAIVRDYILAHPEILPQAMERLEAREVASVINANRTKIETPYAGAWEGAADADVTIVQFFDYACPFCRTSLPVIDRLLAEDKRLRVVFRELPVLGPDSEAAAHASLAAAKTGRWGQFHRALYATGRPDAQNLARVAAAFGIAGARGPEPAREIAANLQLQRELGLSGTPSWIIGDQVLAGAVGYDALKAAIEKARNRG